MLAALDPWFEAFDAGPLDGAPTITQPHGRRRRARARATRRVLLLRPRPEVFDGVDDLDSSRLDAARPRSARHEIAYQHGVGQRRHVGCSGRRRHVGVLLRPATVDQIAATAHEGKLMPPKTTFFAPKPKTGTVFRMLD